MSYSRSVSAPLNLILPPLSVGSLREEAKNTLNLGGYKSRRSSASRSSLAVLFLIKKSTSRRKIC